MRSHNGNVADPLQGTAYTRNLGLRWANIDGLSTDNDSVATIDTDEATDSTTEGFDVGDA